MNGCEGIRFDSFLVFFILLFRPGIPNCVLPRRFSSDPLSDNDDDKVPVSISLWIENVL